MYRKYIEARNKAWQTIIDARINKLPITLSKIAEYYNIQILNYHSNSNDDPEDGYSVNYRGNLIIYYNSNKIKLRTRFTIAHELGHCILGHLENFSETKHRNSEIWTNENIQETQANIFARDLLMPATVLHSLNVSSPEQISEICNVSLLSAEIRFKRLIELNKRGMYNKHPLEKQVYNQFIDFITGNKL